MPRNVARYSGPAPVPARELRLRSHFVSSLLKTFILMLLFGLGASLSTYAQTTSGIAGVVKDSTGAVMPGVLVTITSPAMIEGSRTTTTDSNGQYKFIDLRPGVYAVTFTKSGFQTVRREDIALTTSFTATVDGSLPVGTTLTQVTVSEAAPLVDVQNSVSENVLTRQVLDTIPTGRDPFAEGETVPGVTTSTPDVGGTLGMQQPTLQVHGSNGDDNVIFVDGMWIQHPGFSGNQTGFYYDDSLMQDISYQFNTLPAEAPVGGVEINMVPRDGGNQFHGGFFGSGANSSMESNNGTTALYRAGLVARNYVDSVYDYNAHFGGPFLRNKLWFFGVFRRWGANNFLANTYTSPAKIQQGVDNNRLTDATLRLTWQATKKNKFSVSYDRGFKFRGHRPNNFIGAQFSEPQTDVVQKSWMNYMGQARWTGTLSPRLLVQVGYTLMPVEYNLGPEPGTSPNQIAEVDTSLSEILVTSPRFDNDRGTEQTWDASISYVTGSHDLKTGIQDRYGWFQEAFTSNGDQYLELKNGVPFAVVILNTPLAHREDLDPDLGWYLQDSWQITRRLTINPGIRFEHMVFNIPAQSGGGGLWTPVRHDAAINGIVNWNTWSPRFGFAWDVFGNSKTAVKGGFSKYDVLEGTGLAQNVNPNFIARSTCPWTTFAEATPATLNQATCTGFSGNNNHIDPKMKRPYQLEYTVMIQRQIGANTAVSVGYFGRRYYDLFGVENLAVPPSAYTPFTITNPLTGAPFTVYNQIPSTLGALNLLQTTLSSQYQHYNGVEFQVNTRLHQFTAFAGLTIGKSYGNDNAGSSTDLNNPNNLTNLAGNVGYDAPYQIRSGGSYNLPRGVLFAFTVREDSGLPQSRSFVVNKALDPGLTQVSQTVLVSPPGSYRYSWVNLVDVRMAKTFKLGEHLTFEPSADIFNIFNNSGITSEVTTIGPALERPSMIEFGRLLRVGGRFSF